MIDVIAFNSPVPPSYKSPMKSLLLHPHTTDSEEQTKMKVHRSVISRNFAMSLILDWNRFRHLSRNVPRYWRTQRRFVRLFAQIVASAIFISSPSTTFAQAPQQLNTYWVGWGFYATPYAACMAFAVTDVSYICGNYYPTNFVSSVAPVATPGGNSAGLCNITFNCGGNLDGPYGWGYFLQTSSVYPYKQNPTPSTCMPIVIATGNKMLIDLDFVGRDSGDSSLRLERTYNSLLVRPSGPTLTNQWTHTFSRWLELADSATTYAFRPDGRMYVASSPGAPTIVGFQQWITDSDVIEQVFAQIGTGLTTTGWIVITPDGTRETYDASGAYVLSIAGKDGRTLIPTYSDGTAGANGGYALDASWNATGSVLPAGLLLRVSNQFGRTVQFGYSATMQLVQFTDPSGLNYRYTYGAYGDLSAVVYPDALTKGYLYDEQALTDGGGQYYALTGVVDENGSRFASYWYNNSGQAVQEVNWADATQTISVNSSSVTYSAGSSLVTDPIGSQRLYGFSTVNGRLLPSGLNQPAGAGCGAAASDMTYDANANALSQVDFDGNESCYGYDTSRNLEIARVEGLSSSTACPSSIPAYTPVAPQRITQTQWHPTWRLKVREAAPLKLTTWVYNGQADPTNGNTVASCAPTTALLPDGSPIAVLCKRMEQATTDATGAAGFSPTSNGSPRVWTYTYNQYGQKLTATGPRGNLLSTDPNYAADTTTYVYYASTVAGGYTMGDLSSVTDAAGHTTSYPLYDGNGRVLESIDPNGTTTVYTYFPRGWLKSRTVTPYGATASQGTQYVYDGVGQLKTVTQPDGTQIAYTYDNAHRLTLVTDSAGDSINYTLDAMGNRTTEQVKDPVGTLARQITRVYDALDRLQTVTGALK